MKLTFRPTPLMPEYHGWHDGRFVHLRPGESIEISDAAGAATLVKDYPANFGPAVPAPAATGKALKVPPVDKQIKTAITK